MVQWSQLNNILLEIYDCFSENGQAPWGQLSFSMEQSGKFKVNYLHDVMNEKDGGQLVRELIWARDTFGYAPKEGTPAKEVLDRYSNLPQVRYPCAALPRYVGSLGGRQVVTSPPFPCPVRGLWQCSGRSIRPVYGGCVQW